MEALASGGKERREALLGRLIPPARALPFPALEVDAPRARAVAQGKAITAPGEDGLRRVLGPGGRLLAVSELKAGQLRPIRVMVTPADL